MMDQEIARSLKVGTAMVERTDNSMGYFFIGVFLARPKTKPLACNTEATLACSPPPDGALGTWVADDLRWAEPMPVLPWVPRY